MLIQPHRIHIGITKGEVLCDKHPTRTGAYTCAPLYTSPYVDAQSNGLSMVAERFKNERIGAHVTLTKGERSELAERASQLL